MSSSLTYFHKLLPEKLKQELFITQTWLTSGCVGIALGAIALGFGENNAKNEVWRIVYIINFLLPPLLPVCISQ